MRPPRSLHARCSLVLTLAAVLWPATTILPAQPAAPAVASPLGALHWRAIGPVRAGRARALAGVPTQPNLFYAGFDNGGMWRSTDYGSNWVPLFDDQSTESVKSQRAPAVPWP